MPNLLQPFGAADWLPTVAPVVGSQSYCPASPCATPGISTFGVVPPRRRRKPASPFSTVFVLVVAVVVDSS